MPPPARPARFPIVGIGASAGGLAAYEAFFSAMPADADAGMAFVVVQHLAPDHESILTDLVQRYTRMKVVQVTDGIALRPNCTYVIPPNTDMALIRGTLRLLEPSAPRGLRLPIDFFFRSLAADQHERAICIVLAGTGSDGTLGARAVKGEGGMVMAQAPDSTEYDGMPRSAIATGLVDYVLPPEEMPAQLIAYAGHAFGRLPGTVAVSTPQEHSALAKICILVRSQTGHDFSGYKESTLLRRIDRRMAVNQIQSSADYLRFLRDDPAEIETLFRDFLIGVTSFFRDADAFAALEHKVIPDLISDREPDVPLRIWVCGCSTGEEAYSIAILVRERLDALQRSTSVNLFATDIDPRAIEVARAGAYPLNIASDVSPDRLQRHFTREPGDVFQVRQTIRDMLIFSEHDAVKDPPFSRLDLVSCRNVLIYMGADLHRRLIPLFHYSLRPGGALFLGSSETVGEFSGLFTAADRKWRLYRKIEGTAVIVGTPPGSSRKTPLPRGPRANPPAAGTPASRAPLRAVRTDLRALTERTLLRDLGAVGILVNSAGDILHIVGRTGRFLEPAAGDAALNVLAMAREGLRPDLTVALRRASFSRQPYAVPGVRVRTNGDFTAVDLAVRPVAPADDPGGPQDDLFLVVLEDAPEPPPVETAVAPADGVPADIDVRVAALQQDLRAKDEYLQTAVEEMETSNEELRSTNEEMQSVNEELQAANEELQTAKEEAQSVNEELATVNAELQVKVADLGRVNNDMTNLLASTGVGTIFVDPDLRITRFTPAVTALVPLIDSDIGRPVGDIVSNLVGYDRLSADVASVLASLIPLETEVQAPRGAWFLIRIRPYRTLENVIEGAVVSFVDISTLKELEHRVRLLNATLGTKVRDGRAALKAAAADTLETEDRLRIASDVSGIGTFVIDFRADRVHLSAEVWSILGVPPGAEVNRRKAIALVHPDDRAVVRAAVVASCDPAADGRLAGECRVRRPDGDVRWVAYSGEVELDGPADAREPVRAVCACVDITDRRRREELGDDGS